MFISSNSAFKLAKSDFSDKLDVPKHASVFKYSFVA